MIRLPGALAAMLVAIVAAGSARAEEPPSFGPEILESAVTERHAEGGILRPVPIVVTLPPALAQATSRVLMHYRLWGEPDWTTLELKGQGGRYVGAVPCMQVSTVTGDLKYYLRIHDARGRVIATGASRGKPYLVTIKNDPLLSARKRGAAKCPDPADCPAGLPGCPSQRVVEIRCDRDADCEGGQTCSFRGVCEKARRRKNWLSLAVEQDAGAFATSGACHVNAQENLGFSCFRADGEQYNGNPIYTNEPLTAARGPTRVTAGYDRLLGYDLSVGVRVGVAFYGSGPTPPGGSPFVPVSASARVTHWFREDPFWRASLRPFAFVTAGYGQFDLRGTAHVREDPRAIPFQGGNDLEQRLTIYKRAGDAYFGGGVGLAYEIGSGFGLTTELGLLGVVPYGAFVMAPSAGAMVGF
jgi:hypothetical protein